MRFVAVLSVMMFAGDPVADPVAKSLETAYQATAQKADADAAKAKKTAADKRLKGYRDLLKKHTQAGDFDKATAAKARIDELEEEREVLGLAGAGLPPGSVRFGGHSYLVMPGEFTWAQARRRCVILGGHLMTIESTEEAEFAFKLCQGHTNAWVGATDEKKTGDWRWVTGAAVDKGALKEVLLDNRDGVQHWMVIKRAKQFVDAGADLKCGYICEWDK